MIKFIKEFKSIAFIMVLFCSTNYLMFYSGLTQHFQYLLVGLMSSLCIVSLISPAFLSKVRFEKWGYPLSMISAYCLLKFVIITVYAYANFAQV